MKRVVLDSYALIAYFENEPGAGRVESFLKEAESTGNRNLLSLYNWGEVYWSMYRSKGEKVAEDCLVTMEQLPIEIVDMRKSLMYEAARLKAVHPVAIGDCIAAALAKESNLPVLTGDKEFRRLKDIIQIEWLG
jgi:predicted nucleic acid-binding protein